MRQPPPSYLDPNNVLTAWGSSEEQLGLQVLPTLPFPFAYSLLRRRTTDPHVCTLLAICQM